MAGTDFIVGYLFGRRGFRHWGGRERTRPKMPSTPWRVWAVVCAVVGALVAWLIFRGAGALGWRLVAGAIVGFVVGMYVVETVWERRVRAAGTIPPTGPIGPRH
jgi:hypothetical protein